MGIFRWLSPGCELWTLQFVDACPLAPPQALHENSSTLLLGFWAGRTGRAVRPQASSQLPLLYRLHGKSSNPLSPDKEAVLLTIFSMLFYIPLTFYKWKFVALNSLHLFHSAPPNPALLYLRVCFYLFVCFVIKIQHKSIIIGYVSFCLTYFT